MLVVDTYTLQTVNVLDLRNDVLSQLFDAENTQDIVSARWTICNHFTLLYCLTFEYVQTTPFLDHDLDRITAVVWSDNDTALTFGLFTEGHGT